MIAQPDLFMKWPGREMAFLKGNLPTVSRVYGFPCPATSSAILTRQSGTVAESMLAPHTVCPRFGHRLAQWSSYLEHHEKTGSLLRSRILSEGCTSESSRPAYRGPVKPDHAVGRRHKGKAPRTHMVILGAGDLREKAARPLQSQVRVIWLLCTRLSTQGPSYRALYPGVPRPGGFHT